MLRSFVVAAFTLGQVNVLPEGRNNMFIVEVFDPRFRRCFPVGFGTDPSPEGFLFNYETNSAGNGQTKGKETICIGTTMNKNAIKKHQSLIFKLVLVVTVASLLVGCHTGQVPDKSYSPSISDPAYQKGKGPLVCLDEAHNNFHTLNNRFWAFGELLRRDGYVVESGKEKFSAAILKHCAILVIANAQLEGTDWGEYPYPTPSGFTDEEIDAVQTWVKDGGSLLLIADHMPLAGVASKIASAFGVEFNNGFAVAGFDGEENRDAAFEKPTIFSIETKTLISGPITDGRTANESVTSIRTFTGQAFQAPASAQPLMVLPDDFVLLMPEEPWIFQSDTKTIPVGGWLQGAVMPFGSGRAAFFGEAAMFSAQLTDGEPSGMNAPMAEQNFQLVLNVMHWLSGILN